jgi:hypothetical protein
MAEFHPTQESLQNFLADMQKTQAIIDSGVSITGTPLDERRKEILQEYVNANLQYLGQTAKKNIKLEQSMVTPQS